MSAEKKGKQVFNASINGQDVEILVEPSATLLEVLRDSLDMIGTKEGCGEGVCGSCTVLVGGLARRACLTLALEANGLEVLTIEGMAPEEGLSPEQEAFIELGAIQCGFCTPGMLIASKDLLDQNPAPSREDIMRRISGHVCRCSGYAKIFEAVEAAAKRRKGEDAS